MTVQRFDYFRDQEPMAKNILQKIAKSDPGGTLSSFDEFKEAPYAIEIVDIATKQALKDDPDALLAYCDTYKDQHYADEYVKKALLKTKPKNAFLFLKTHRTELEQKSYFETTLKDVAFRAARSDPSQLFHFEAKSLYKGKSYEKEVVKLAIFTLSDTEPDYALICWDSYKDEPYAAGILDKVVPAAARTNPYRTICSFQTYKDRPYAEPVLENAFRELLIKEPENVFFCLGTEEKRPYFDELRKSAAFQLVDEKPYVVINEFESFKETSYAEDILKKGLFRCTMIVPEYLKKYDEFKDRPYWTEVVDIGSKRLKILEALQENNDMRDDEALLKDPALANVHLIEDAWLPELDSTEFLNFASYICRNLYLQNQEVTKENVRNEYERILRIRDQYANVPLFYHRNIVVASHQEKQSETDDNPGIDMFANEYVIAALHRQQGEGYEFKQYEQQKQTPGSSNRAKEKVLKSIEQTSSPLTFVWTGHGGPDAIYFSDGIIQGGTITEKANTRKITTEEFAEALKLRGDRIGKEKIAQDVFIFEACYNHTFIRDVYARLDQGNYGKPIMIGEAEYDQLGIGNKLMNEYNSPFFRNVLDLGAQKSTIGDLWKNDQNGQTNPSVYIPTIENIPTQISQVSPSGDQGIFA